MASADNTHGPEPYSTLEVRSVEASNPKVLRDTNKQVVSNPENEYPQVVESSNKEVVPNADSQYPQVVGAQAAWDVPKPDTPYADTEATAVQGQNAAPARRTICGLSPRIFYIILGGAILVIVGALVGGLAGGLTSIKKSPNSSSSSPASNPTASVNVLSQSKLAASNWTDPSGYVHRSVFFQDPYNAIIARQWDSQNKTWETRNVSQFMQSSTSGPINPNPGTSLTSASCDSKYNSLYEVHLFFSEPGEKQDVISWVNSNNPIHNPDFWVYNASGLPTWNDTQLAAAWQRCPNDNCVGSWTLAYQGREGYIRVANASNWGNNSLPVIRTNAVSASASMAIVPALYGTYVDGMLLATQRRPGSMGKSTFLGDWNWKEDDGTIIDDVDPLKTRQFAASPMNNFTESFFVSLSNDGSITGAKWDGSAYTAVPKITFSHGHSTNFSAIAMTEDAMFYGIADDEIWEYSIDTSDPSTFTYSGKIYP